MIHLRHALRGLAALAVVVVGSGCSSSSKSPATGETGVLLNYCDLPKPCQDISQACHPKDDGSPGTVHDCHITGHEIGTLAACNAKYTQCIQACTAAPALSDGPVEDLAAACRDGGAAGGSGGT